VTNIALLMFELTGDREIFEKLVELFADHVPEAKA
jgi:hypothetical protein